MKKMLKLFSATRFNYHRINTTYVTRTMRSFWARHLQLVSSAKLIYSPSASNIIYTTHDPLKERILGSPPPTTKISSPTKFHLPGNIKVTLAVVKRGSPFTFAPRCLNFPRCSPGVAASIHLRGWVKNGRRTGVRARTSECARAARKYQSVESRVESEWPSGST